jgi:hypothetical protein
MSFFFNFHAAGALVKICVSTLAVIHIFYFWITTVGTQFFWVSLQIANPQILGLILQSQILIPSFASPQIANLQICDANHKSANFEKSSVLIHIRIVCL